MSVSEDSGDLSGAAAVNPAAQLVRRLVRMYAGYALGLSLLLALGAWFSRTPHRFGALPVEAFHGGLGATALASVLLSLAALCATGVITVARFWRRRADALMAAGEIGPAPADLLARVWNLGPGVMGREGQAVALPLGAIAISLIVWRLWPTSAAPAADANLVAALMVGLAFPSLIAERVMNGFSATEMPEAPGLRRLLLLTTLTLAIGAVAEIARGVGLLWASWILRALDVVTVLVAAELALRALARLFLPRPLPEASTAATDSIVAALLTGGARAPAALLRTHFGLDFARSWALSFLLKAAMPALIATLLFCWLLSGVKLLDSDQRGVYERLGAPVAVLGPGFHVLMPWPLGRLRPVEFGAVHTLAIGAVKGAAAAVKIEETGKIGAEDTPTASMNRLWETNHATEAEYLVASQAEGQQGFQAVNAEIFVLYRTGLTNRAAMQSVYGSADPAAVVEQEGNRLVTRYFSSHTLDGVMGGQRESLQQSLRDQLQQAVAADGAGVDILAVLIDAIHPPAGAAAAYHAVQAAEINAAASVSNATGHALRTAGKAQEEAAQATDAAQATAVEKVQAASGDAYQFNADRSAHRGSPQAFLMERRNRSLIQTLRGARLTVVDAHLKPDQVPLFDMRTAGAQAGRPAGAATGTAAPSHDTSEAAVGEQQIPSTSTEGSPPASTSEEATEDSAKSHAKPGYGPR
jgi:regulator of protease activity HflC (stomatin/prohibitin superfamily)